MLCLNSRFCALGRNRSLSWASFHSSFLRNSLRPHSLDLHSPRAASRTSSGLGSIPANDTKILKPKCSASGLKYFMVPPRGIEPYRFSTPIGYIFSQAQNIAQSGFDSSDQNKKPGTRPSFLFRCPREESNLELRLRSPQLYPFNYRGLVRAKGLEPLTYPV